MSDEQNEIHEDQDTQRNLPTIEATPISEPASTPNIWGWLRTLSTVVLWGLALTSLALNLLVLRQLALAWGLTREAVHDAIVVLEEFEKQSFTYTVVVDDTIEVNTDMPIKTTIPVEVDETIPVGGTARVPLETPFGTFNVDVPFGVSVPLDLTVDVVIDENFPLDTEIPIYLEVPIEIAIRDTPLAGTLRDLRTRLVALEERLTPFGQIQEAE